jgi:hypothetical protein
MAGVRIVRGVVGGVVVEVVVVVVGGGGDNVTSKRALKEDDWFRATRAKAMVRPISLGLAPTVTAAEKEPLEQPRAFVA